MVGGVKCIPRNDNFEDAYQFSGNYGRWSGTTRGASREPDEDAFSVPGSGERTIWFGFRSSHGGLINLDLVSKISGFRLIAFEGATKATLKITADSGKITGSEKHQLRFNAKPETEYRLVLTSDLLVQMFALSYTETAANDFFRDATVLGGEEFSAVGSNHGATAELFETAAPHAGNGRGKSVWWKWTAEKDASFTINTAGSGFDTVLAVYSGPAPGSLVEIASNDDRNAFDYTSQVGFSAMKGTTYYIAVDSYRGDASGSIRLNGFQSGQLAIVSHPKSVTVANGGRAVFEVTSTRGQFAAHQWYFNDRALPGEIRASLVVDPVGTGDFGIYKVLVSDTEGSVFSQPATSGERLSAPVLAWESGNQSVGSGSSVSLGARFTGSAPIGYTWSKNGVPLPGITSNSIDFSSATSSDAGTYKLTATNQIGSASVELRLSIVESPFERWEWRRPGIPSVKITGMKAYGDMVYALAGEYYLKSMDGQNWTRNKFPNGFSAVKMEKSPVRMVAVGRMPDGSIRTAVSTTEGAWSYHAPTGLPAAMDLARMKLSVFGSRFLLQTQGQGSFFTTETLFYSDDGILWRQSQLKLLNGQTTMSFSGSTIAAQGNLLIMGGLGYSSSSNTNYYSSSDGINWTEFLANGVFPQRYGGSTNAVQILGKLYLLGGQFYYVSADGVNWQYRPTLGSDGGISGGDLIAGDSTIAYAFEHESRAFKTLDAGGLVIRTIIPGSEGSQYSVPDGFVSAATMFAGKLIYGSSTGYLGMAATPADVRLPTALFPQPASVNFTDGLFTIFFERALLGTTNLLPRTSGDGVTWKESNALETDSSKYLPLPQNLWVEIGI